MGYERFFQESKRVSGSNKRVLIINPDLFTQFMEAVAADSKLPADIKIFCLVAASSGGRVSEVLSLHKKDFNSNGLFDLAVLKKKRKKRDGQRLANGKYEMEPDDERTRLCRLHQAAVPIVDALLAHRKPQEFLLRADRNQILYGLKKHFGPHMECHSFRHSHVSYLMNKGMTHLKIAKLVDIDVNNVSKYSHLNQAKTLEEIF